MYKTNTVIALLAITALAGCGDHIHDPWVTGDHYFKEDRFHAQELNEELRHRMSNQRDR